MEGREFTRVPIHVEVQLECEAGSIKSTQTKDLSMKGVLVESDQQWPLHQECDVSLVLHGAEPIYVKFRGRVERILDSGMAIEFFEMGLESYEHLQQLLRYNAQNSDQIDKEINQHVGLKKKD
ncbi:MAG: PilZ domain-containing protein [Candidatus Nitrohelix vancouverensis]|uniref:PilZ domain-containing protein n=1 Tax=Candidatus Nitrohelix vancouverensis TaxID=2705534 RepID=A0A7T0G485_9BACT|nr:MAG: PilZ domain-containing protein [Candidatus Nitrohelix vancouverensis]